MIVRGSGVDWRSRRAELLKSFAGQEVLCLTEDSFPPDASLRRKLHHHLTSLCLMMLFCSSSQTLRLRTTSEPLRKQLTLSNGGAESGLASLSRTEMLTDNEHRERRKVVFRPAGNFSHISFAFVIKNHFAWCYLKFQWNRLHLFSPGCVAGSQECRGIKAPRHPGTPSWATRRRGTRSRSCPPSWCRRSGWPGARTPASQSSGPSTDTPLERRSHRAKRDSAQSADIEIIPLLALISTQKLVSDHTKTFAKL